MFQLFFVGYIFLRNEEKTGGREGQAEDAWSVKYESIELVSKLQLGWYFAVSAAAFLSW